MICLKIRVTIKKLVWKYGEPIKSIHMNIYRDKLFTDQLADWYRAYASGSVDLGFDSESGQTNDLKIGIHSFPA